MRNLCLRAFWGAALTMTAAVSVPGCIDIPDYSGLMSSLNALTAASSHPAARLVHGTLTLHPPGENTSVQTVEPTLCRSGQARSFVGVDLVSTGTGAVYVRVAEDPIAGVRLRVQRAGNTTPWILDASRCRTLASLTQPGGVAINRIQLVHGTLDMDCTAEDGTVIAGELQYDNCHTSEDADAAVLAVTDGARMAALPAVPDPETAPALPPALRALRVRVTPRVVGSAVLGDTDQAARAACLAGSVDFVRTLGWVPVTERGAPHDLDVEMACSGHVLFRTIGDQTEIDVPDAGSASVRFRAGGQEIASIPPAPRQWRCTGPGTRADRERQCGDRLGRANEARLVRLIATSAPLEAWADQLHRGTR